MGQNLGLGRRHNLKEREIKEILRRAAATLGDIDHTFLGKGMEVVKIAPQDEVFLMDGVAVFIDVNEEVLPSLLNEEIIDKLPRLTVDMGAVPHLCNGADLMAPGIVKITGEFQAEALAVVVDERFSKPIALVKTLYNSREISEKRQGKVARNIHYVGDRFWKAFKQMKNKA